MEPEAIEKERERECDKRKRRKKDREGVDVVTNCCVLIFCCCSVFINTIQHENITLISLYVALHLP
jgi:hypothetical protein